jgi:hypothetical protein
MDRRQDSQSGSHDGSTVDIDDNKSIASSRSKASSLHKTKSISKKKGAAATGGVGFVSNSGSTAACSPDIFNNTDIN